MTLNNMKSECLKFFYSKWLFLTFLLSIGLIPVLISFVTLPENAISFDSLANQLLQSFYMGQVGFVVLTSLYFGQEFLNHTIRTSLLALPNRFKFLFLKIISLLVLELVCLLVTTILSFIVISIRLDVSMTTETAFRLLKLLLPCYLATIQLSFITAALVLLSSSIVFSLSLVLPMILGLGQLLLQFTEHFKILPVLSTMNVFSRISSSIYPTVTTGLLLQSVWSIIFLISAYYFLYNKCIR